MIDRQRFKHFKFSESDFQMLDKYEKKGWKFDIEESFDPHTREDDEYFNFQSPRMKSPTTLWITPFTEQELIQMELNKVLYEFMDRHEHTLTDAISKKILSMFEGDKVPDIKDVLKVI